MKILKEFPNTVTQLVTSITELPDELDAIKCLNFYEILKCLPTNMIVEGNLIDYFVPQVFVNRFKTQEENGRLRSLSKKIWDLLMH